MGSPAAGERPPPRRRPAAHVTTRDRELLAFAAGHRFILTEHVCVLLGVSERTAAARLRALRGAGLLRREHVFHASPACHLITRKGLALIDCAFHQPRLDLREYLHDAGATWLWLAAQRGAFGDVREVISERQLRSRDSAFAEQRQTLAVRLGGYGPQGRPRLHYPDLLLETETGHRIAVELELTGKGRQRLETILGGYGADARVDAVVYVVSDRTVARDVQQTAARLGISRLVHVQAFKWGASLAPLENATAAVQRGSGRHHEPELAR